VQLKVMQGNKVEIAMAGLMWVILPLGFDSKCLYACQTVFLHFRVCDFGRAGLAKVLQTLE
jgi:hypothetical protein